MSEREGGVWIWTLLMGELCLVPDSFLCLVLEELSAAGTDSDLERGGVGRMREGGSDMVIELGRAGEGPRSRLAVMMGLERGGVS